MPDGVATSDRQEAAVPAGRRPCRPGQLAPAVAVGSGLLVVILVLLGAFLLLPKPGAPAPGGQGAPTTGAGASATAGNGAVAGNQAGNKAGLGVVLARRATALLRHDRAGWLAAVDPGASSLLARQAAQFDRISALPVLSWQYQVVDLSPTTGAAAAAARLGTGTFVARIELAYRLAADTRDVRRTRTATVRSQSGDWLLESEAPATDADRDLWDLAPLTVVRGARSVAVSLTGAPSAALALAETQALAGWVDAAAQSVDAVWGLGWPRSVVVVLPADLTQMAAVLGHIDGTGGTGPDGLGQLSAVTSGPLDRGRTGPHAVAGAADRVVLNPVVWDRLTAAGRRVVLVHELVHVATRATTSATPVTWLDEGFATYIGYRGAGLTDAEIAADALPELRAGRRPTALPGPERFDPTHGDPASAYAQAWVACDLVSRRVGVDGLTALYRAAASAGGGQAQVAVALRRVLGNDVEAFTVQWQERLSALAGAGS